MAISKKQLETAIAKAFAKGFEKGYDEGYLDGEADNRPDKPQLFVEYVATSDNKTIVRGFLYGPEWVGMQLFMEGGFPSKEEAYLYWYKEMTKDDPEHGRDQ